MYMSIRTLDYVIFLHQANLSKTTKHWDGFVSHCMTSFSSIIVTKILSIINWNMAGELHIPKNITVGLNSPLFVLKVAFHSSPFWIHILL